MPETGKDMLRRILKSLELTESQKAILLELGKKGLMEAQKSARKIRKIMFDLKELTKLLTNNGISYYNGDFGDFKIEIIDNKIIGINDCDDDWEMIIGKIIN